MITTLSQLVAKVESANCAHALRHEPGFTKYVTPQGIANCIAGHRPAYMNRTTAEMICKTSFGTYQIMGENIYTVCGFKRSIAEFFDSDAIQLACFQAFIKGRGINYTLEQIKESRELRERFARRYNGSVAYAETLRKAW